MNHSVRKWVCFSIVCAFTGLLAIEASAFANRPNRIPNGNLNSCANCHDNPFGGGPRNAFGQDVEMFTATLGENFWTPELAELDSDSDGFTNGEELQDPDGSWTPGEPQPGDASAVSLPGDPNSVPPLQADYDSFVAVLHSQNLTAPVPSPGRGVAIFRLSPNGTEMDYILQVFDLDNVTAAHIHAGAAGQDGGVVYPLEAPISGQTSGTFTIDPADLPRFQNGELYVNVHTQANPGGEIRGQVEDEPIQFKSEMSGAKVVPDPIDSPGMGSASVELSEDWQALSWDVEVSGLENVLFAHFHFGGADETGGVMLTISSSPFTQVSDSGAITMENLEQMIAEDIYINVHTEAFSSGEIRGQVVYDAEFPVQSAVRDWLMLH